MSDAGFGAMKEEVAMSTSDRSTHPSNAAQGAQAEHSSAPARGAMMILIVTAFLNAMGIGLVMPILPFIVRRYISDPAALAPTIGWLASLYAICQFLAAPGLGALSDRYGRRPILLICLLGSAIGYLLFGFGGALWVLFLGRIIDGLTGGNFSILSAYIGDVTPPKERSRYFGIIGAVFGVGFIVGPAIGGFASRISYEAPLYIAAGVTIATMLISYFALPESLRKENRASRIRLLDLNLVKQLGQAFAMPQLRWLLMTAFCYALPFAVLQSNWAVLLIDSLGWAPDQISFLFLIVGGLDILMQGVLSGRLLKIFSETTVTIAGFVFAIMTYLLMGTVVFIPSAVLVYAGIVLFGVSSGLIEPALRGLISQAAGPREQGVVQGSSQSIQSLAMIVGPLVGAALYTGLGHASPYWLGAVIFGLGILMTLLAVPALQAVRPAADMQH
jgi:MFS transporter, DHA1 family, tetracycline resistance protein